VLGFFPISADAISGEGAAQELGVQASTSAGILVASLSLAITGVTATAAASSVAVGIGLAGNQVSASVSTLPSISVAVSFSGGGTFTPYALTWVTTSAFQNPTSGWYGFQFNTGGNTPRISHLGRYRLASNSGTHNLRLYQYVDGAGGDALLGSASVDLSTGPDYDFVYGRLTSPVTLAASTTYYIISEESSTGDQFFQDHWSAPYTRLTTFTSGIATEGGSVHTTSLGSVTIDQTSDFFTFGPLNFKVVTGAEAGVQAATSIDSVAVGHIVLDGISATGSVGSPIASLTRAISGTAGQAYVGSVDVPGQLALVGQSATGSAGTTAPQSLVAISGSVATAAVGTVGIGTAAFTGVSATASPGSLSVANVSRKLRGIAATAALTPLSLPLTPALVGGASRVRWVGYRVLVDGTDLTFGLSGPMTIDSSLDIGQQNRLSCHVSDSAWPAAGKLWGNKPAEAYLSLGDSPRFMNETKLFTGYTFQKRDAAGTPAETDLVCTDSSLAYTGIPVCYSLGAYSGKTRGQVITEVAATVGVTLTDVPTGGIINKPVTLNNADLLQWIADFGLVENWYPHIDRDGNLSVRLLGEPTAAWVLDSEKGDFDLGTLAETYPTRPPCRWYVTGTQAIQVTAEDDPDSPERITTVQVDEEQAVYNPKCRISYDPTGHSLPAAELMVVARITTEITTVGGDEVRRVTTTESFYNPAAYDPNHDTFPAGSDYANAYLDKSFHRDAIESLMETSRATVETVRDEVGTVLSQHSEALGWYSPQSFLVSRYDYKPEEIINASGHFIYSDGKAHMTTEETYQTVSAVDTTYEYDPVQGTLLNQVSTIQGFTAPESACDMLVTCAGNGAYLGPLISAQVSNAGVSTGGGALPDWAPSPDYAWQNQFISFNFYFLFRRFYKWGEQDWRSQPNETLQMAKRVTTKFTVVDGQVVTTKETTEGFARFESGPSAHPESDAAPFLYADGKWYEARAETFEITGVKFTHYEKFGSTGHARTTYSVNLVTGEVTIEPPAYSDGTMPLAPTIGSALRWARLPIVIEVEVSGCEFVDSKQNLDLPWAENVDDLNRAGLRAAQRATAVIRELDCAWNPLVEPGDGLLLTSLEHGISSEWHIITDVRGTVDIGADMHVTAERWSPV